MVFRKGCPRLQRAVDKLPVVIASAPDVGRPTTSDIRLSCFGKLGEMTDPLTIGGYSVPIPVDTHISEMKLFEEQQLLPNDSSPDQRRFKLTTHGSDEYSAVEMQDETTSETVFTHHSDNAGCVLIEFRSQLYPFIQIT